MNAFVEPEERPIETLTVDDRVETDQIAALRTTRLRRDSGEVERCLNELARAAATCENLVVPLLAGGPRPCIGRRDHERAGGRLHSV